MKRLFNKICLLGNGSFSNQLLQDLKIYKYQIYLNQKKIFLNSFLSLDSRDIYNKNIFLYLLTVANPVIKQKIISDLSFLSPEYIDAVFLDSSVSKKIKFNKNLIVWKSFIGDYAEFDNNIYIGPYSIIAPKVKIGENTSIYPRVSILKNSKIGKNVTIGTNTVITDGCHIEDNVIIGPNMTIYENIPKNTFLIK